MDKEREINELAHILIIHNCDTNGCGGCDWSSLGLNSCDDYLHYFDMATKINNAGYRKADEVRKETAKEILRELYGWDNKIDDMILALANAYGVEVE